MQQGHPIPTAPKKRMMAVLYAAALAGSVIFSYRLYYHDKIPFISPVSYIGAIPIRNDGYGSGLFSAGRSGGRQHKGIDIESELGAPVRAVKGGIAEVCVDEKGYGRHVIVRHSKALSTLYAHLGEVYAQNGIRIRQGSIIGTVGKTGNARYNGIKPHLHFEAIVNGERVDPIRYFGLTAN